MANNVQSTALILYKPPVSTAQFIQNEAVRAEKLTADCFPGQDLEGRVTAQLASKVASQMITKNPEHAVGRIISGYMDDFHFVNVTRSGEWSRTIARKINKEPELERFYNPEVIRAYIPNNYRQGFDTLPNRPQWLCLRWKYMEDRAKAKAAFLAKVEQNEDYRSRHPSSELVKTLAQLRQEADPDLFKE